MESANHIGRFDQGTRGPVKSFFRNLIRAVGTGSILIGSAACAATQSAASTNEAGFTIFLFMTVGLVPLLFGYLFFLCAQDEYDRGVNHARSDDRVRKLGYILGLSFVLLVAANLPASVRVVLAIVLLLTFARIHRPWASRGVRTRWGFLSFGDVYDFTVGGIAFLLVNAVLALLTGGLD